MIPAFKRNQEAAPSGPIESLERTPDNQEDLDYLEGCIQELVLAIKSGDVKAAARAFKDAFQVCDAAPHEEGPHIG